MKNYLIVGNWKMNNSMADTKLLCDEILKLMPNVINTDVVICPPFTSLAVAASILSKKIGLGAQNLYPQNSGAFTGEIAPSMIRDIGASYVILGHSERRSLFNESNQFINAKAVAALAQDLIPIICVGETEKERENNETIDVISSQLKECLQGIDNHNIVIAYEPIWAIGTGKTATPKIAQEIHSLLRKLLVEKFGDNGRMIRILYGGSMKPENAKELLLQDDIDGGLIGGASLKSETFCELIKIAESI
jgi:triosephosphate isomerase